MERDTFRGSAEEIIREHPELLGLEVEIRIVSKPTNEGPAERLKRWREALTKIDSYKGKLPVLPLSATSTQALYE